MQGNKHAPQVLIIGAGLGGLMTALLLEHAGISYSVYERAPKVKPLGVLMSLGANILPVFEQLGLYKPLMEIAFPIIRMNMYTENMDEIGVVEVDDSKTLIGYDAICFPRPDLYDLILSQVPNEKIHFNKKVIAFHEDEAQVTIDCEDGTSYHGDILVGADGAYSSVRHLLYERVALEGLLPASDSEDLSLSYVCMVGTTDPMDPEKYPQLKDDQAHLSQIVGDGTPYSWTTISVPGNRFCWSVVVQLPQTTTATDSQSRNSEWGPEANESMIKEIYNFPNGVSGIMGELTDATPRERISKVMLEEKLFETWYSGRVVLLGD
ncbi:hypothetical protein BGZ68_005603, partial [Mortierella alpina]